MILVGTVLCTRLWKNNTEYRIPDLKPVRWYTGIREVKAVNIPVTWKFVYYTGAPLASLNKYTGKV
jgi:hypothetical protein